MRSVERGGGVAVTKPSSAAAPVAMGGARTRSLLLGRSHDRIDVMTALALTLVFFLALPEVARAAHDEIVDKRGRALRELVSVDSRGDQGSERSSLSASCGGGDTGVVAPISDGGRYIVFTSAARLHPSDANGELLTDVYVRDRTRGSTELVSALETGLSPPAPPDLPDLNLNGCGAYSPAISGSGRYIAFVSFLPLTEDASTAGLAPQVYVRDLKRKETRLVSVDSDGQPAEGAGRFVAGTGAYGVSISDNGRYIAFHSAAANLPSEEEREQCAQLVPVPTTLLPGDCGSQIYVHDRKNRKTSLVSKSSEGEPSGANELVAPPLTLLSGPSTRNPIISGDGRFVSFSSSATNLVEEDFITCAPSRYEGGVRSCWNVYVHDIRKSETELISVGRDGGAGDEASGYHSGAINDSGRYVLFLSWASNLVPANPPASAASRAYVRDRKMARTERVSVSSTGTMIDANSSVSVSDDGRYVYSNSFGCPHDHPLHSSICEDQHRLSGYSNGWGRYDRATGQREIFVGDRHCNEGGDRGGGFVAGNGRYTAYTSGCKDTQVGDRNDSVDVFFSDLGPHTTGARSLSSPRLASRSSAPGAGVKISDAVGDAAGALGADLIGARVIERPELDDLYIKIDLQRLQTTPLLAGGTPLLYGLELIVEGRAYEVRVASGSLTSPLDPVFGLFSCDEVCEEIATLKGGFGTVGENVVVSVPLHALGAERGETIGDVRVFSAYGTYEAGALSAALDEALGQ